jgi:hypothetical protein
MTADSTNVAPDRAHNDARGNRTPYATPVLHVYGNVELVTKTVGMSGKTSDGGGAPGMSKTS